MPSFREPPWASALLTSTVKRKELSICWQFVVFYVEDPCLSIAFAFTAVMVASHAMQRLSSISVASFTAATTAIAGAPSASTDWIIWSFTSARPFRQSAHLWPFVAQRRYPPSDP